jgi:hypothetical protein
MPGVLECALSPKKKELFAIFARLKRAFATDFGSFGRV